MAGCASRLRQKEDVGFRKGRVDVEILMEGRDIVTLVVRSD
jgi:hypothetical protein